MDHPMWTIVAVGGPVLAFGAIMLIKSWWQDQK
jgi:hypothetical protein